MVLDYLCECERYAALHPRFQEAFDFLKGAAERPNGRYELGDGMYVSLSETTTRPVSEELLAEAHRKYIDIQYLLNGHSLCGWARTQDLVTRKAYDEEQDAELLSGKYGFVPVSEGIFYILFPNDAHAPHCADGEPSACRVAVVKVPLAE